MGQNGTKRRFRGSYLLKLDDRGRIKVPSKYLSILEEQYGREIYITSLNGDHVLLYPLQIWEGIEQAIEQMKVRSPAIEEYISRTSFWGNESEVDGRGRLLIPPELRKQSKLNEEVRLFGKIDYLEAWNEEMFRSTSLAGKFTSENLQEVSRLISQFNGGSNE